MDKPITVFYFDGVHLISPRLDDLHFLAKEIGLRREYFQGQDKHIIPHYDVWGEPARKLLTFGSVVRVDQKELVRIGIRLYPKAKGVVNDTVGQ